MLRLILAALLLAAPAAAAPWRAEYALTVAGVTVMEAQILFELDAAGYRVETRVRSRGVANLVARGEQVTRAEGAWRGDSALPRSYATEGKWRGTARRTVLDYAAGRPVVRALEPAEDMPRTPIPPESLPGTVDSLTALAVLARRVDRAASCDVAVRMFDARRLTEFSARTLGQEPAGLRCEVESRQLAGIPVDRDPQEARRPQAIQAWFARPVANGPAIPLRVDLASRWWGRVEAHLIRLEPARRS